MEHSLREALNIGYARSSAIQEERNIAQIWFKNLRDQANTNTFRSAQYNKTKGRNLGVADFKTGLITIPNNFGDTMREIEQVESRENIVDTLLIGKKKDTRRGVESSDSKFYSNSWLNIGGKSDSSKQSWDDVLKLNKRNIIKTELPSGQQVRGIPFGDESSLKVLFKTDKIKELD